MRAYRFLGRDMRGGQGDGAPWTKGETRMWGDGDFLYMPLYLSSPSWWDALSYAPGPVACIVDVEGTIYEDNRIQESTSHTLVDYRDATSALQTFAVECIEREIDIDAIEIDDDDDDDDNDDDDVAQSMSKTCQFLGRKISNQPLFRNATITEGARYSSRRAVLAVQDAVPKMMARLADFFPKDVVAQITEAAAKAAGEAEKERQRRRLDELIMELFQKEESDEK